MKTTVLFLVFAVSFSMFGQNDPDLRRLSKSDLRKLVNQLKAENEDSRSQLQSVKDEKEYLSEKLNRIAPIKIDEVINLEEVPVEVVIGDGGWRIEKNALKYKSDLIGQLGTLWIQGQDGQIFPQGYAQLSKYEIEADLVNPEKDIIYKKFVSKGTTLSGEGGMPFVKLKSKMSQNGYSKFSINIEGTSQIKPTYENIVQISSEVDDLFNNPDYKGVYICTGMHVIKYKATLYSKTDVNSTVSSPVVLIDGEFYAESSDEYSEYLVVRQLTELNPQAKKKEKSFSRQLDNVTDDPVKIAKKSQKLSPQQILFYILGEEPTFDQITSFMNNPEQFAADNGFDIDQNENNRQLINQVISKSNPLPNEIASDD